MRVLPEEERLQQLDDELGVAAAGAAGSAEKGVADRARVGLDGDEAEIAHPHGRDMAAIAGRGDVVPGE